MADPLCPARVQRMSLLPPLEARRCPAHHRLAVEVVPLPVRATGVAVVQVVVNLLLAVQRL